MDSFPFLYPPKKKKKKKKNEWQTPHFIKNKPLPITMTHKQKQLNLRVFIYLHSFPMVEKNIIKCHVCYYFKLLNSHRIFFF